MLQCHQLQSRMCNRIITHPVMTVLLVRTRGSCTILIASFLSLQLLAQRRRERREEKRATVTNWLEDSNNSTKSRFDGTNCVRHSVGKNVSTVVYVPLIRTVQYVGRYSTVTSCYTYLPVVLYGTVPYYPSVAFSLSVRGFPVIILYVNLVLVFYVHKNYT